MPLPKEHFCTWIYYRLSLCKYENTRKRRWGIEVLTKIVDESLHVELVSRSVFLVDCVAFTLEPQHRRNHPVRPLTTVVGVPDSPATTGHVALTWEYEDLPFGFLVCVGFHDLPGDFDFHLEVGRLVLSIDIW